MHVGIRLGSVDIPFWWLCGEVFSLLDKVLEKQCQTST